MAFRVILTTRAEADIDSATAWVAYAAPGAAARWYSRLVTAINSLDHMPERCPLADEADELGIDLRELLFGRRRGVFRILFTVSGDTVTVLRIHRATRGPVTEADL